MRRGVLKKALFCQGGMIMYTVLACTIKDAGDFLITERGEVLLKTYSKQNGILRLNNWQPLDDRLDEINKTKAIILCGGAGYSRNFYPEIFPPARNIDDIKVPIIPLGLGWVGYPMWQPDKFSFSNSSKSLLQRIHQNCKATSCRDNITKEILNRHGFKNVIMTGCPAWYDLKSIGKKFEQPKEIHRVAVSMAGGEPKYFKLQVELLQEVKKLLTRLYPQVELYAAFHRGIEEDRYTSRQEATALQQLKRIAEQLRYRVVDASYGTSKLEFYRECDFHVGFRVHAHIFFLSIRKPTFLLQIDGRGRGLSETLGLPDVAAASKSRIPSGLYPRIAQFDLYSKPPTYILDKMGIRKSVAPLARPLYHMVRAIQKSAATQTTSVNQKAIGTIVKDIETELINGFQRFQGLDSVLDSYFGEMVSFLKDLP